MDKIVFICTNYNSIEDGIGMYTANIRKELNLNSSFISADTTQENKMSLKMSKTIWKYITNNKHNRYEAIKFIIEYPFMDWNPLTLINIFFLKFYFKKSKFILSIHEYYRVNKLRRYAINFLIKISDAYVVTDKKLYEKLKGEKRLRGIPSNIEKIKIKEAIVRKQNTYCYFGLINKSKAFEEMLEAWKLFNRDKKYFLNIYTSSSLILNSMENSNIKLFRGLSNEELSLEFQKNKFMILPIKPMIDKNNGTLKAAALHGCIPIGIFNEKLEKIGLNITCQSYTSENIKEALDKSLEIKGNEYIKNLKIYSNQFSFKKNSEELINFIKSLDKEVIK